MPDRLPEINLLPEVRHESAAQAILLFVFVGLVIISFIVMGFLYFSTNSKLSSAQTKSNELSDERDTLLIQKASLETDEDSHYEQAVNFAEYYAVPTSTLITELNRLLPEKSYLSEYAYSNAQVNIVTHFETLDTAANYTSKLINSEYLTDTKVESINTFSLKEEEADDGSAQFDVIPRYEGNFSLTIDKRKIKEESATNE